MGKRLSASFRLEGVGPTAHSKCFELAPLTHNLKLDPLPVQLYCPDFEVDTDGSDEGWRPRIVAEP